MHVPPLKIADMKVTILAFLVALAHATPVVTDCNNVTYHGLYKDQVEYFWGIRFAHDTAGPNGTDRFKPPKPYVPAPGSIVEATEPGPACPQQLGAQDLPLYLGNVTSISEDCLRLNIVRPNGTDATSNLPVLVWVYGGSFVTSFKDDPVSAPGGLILESVANGNPIMHVAMNYRLGVFGFAKSDALQTEGSENAGLRDQRLALEFVRDKISDFGGNPNNITIHGQSSGGLAMGMQILAYGASKPPPFQQAIAQSQALEGGITGNFTRNAMQAVANDTGCNSTALGSAATLECLRRLSMDDLLDSQLATAQDTPSYNGGDIWLPSVDGDFLPAAPSTLIETGRFYNTSVMFGWCDDDANIFIDPSVQTANDTYHWTREYLPEFTEDNINQLLSMYPPNDFHASYLENGSVDKAAEFYRAARIFRDILFVCQAVNLGNALQKSGNRVYLYDQNQTILTPVLDSFNLTNLGPVHTSELAYVFGNLSHFDMYNFPYDPKPADFALKTRESRSWSSFTALGYPTVEGKNTLQGWKEADFENDNLGVYVIGGPYEGDAGVNGNAASAQALEVQKLHQRCGFLNRPEVIKQQEY